MPHVPTIKHAKPGTRARYEAYINRLPNGMCSIDLEGMAVDLAGLCMAAGDTKEGFLRKCASVWDNTGISFDKSKIDA